MKKKKKKKKTPCFRFSLYKGKINLWHASIAASKLTIATMQVSTAFVILFIVNGVCCIPLNEFFPYGGDAEETSSSLRDGNDFAFEAKSPAVPFVFYGNRMNSVVVSLSFSIATTAYIRKCYSIPIQLHVAIICIACHIRSYSVHTVSAYTV